ncbi:MAG: dihydrolipoyl dehydrogenase [Pseudomonadota bacterium]|nr:dihydrolipoyl dehydrogenase [Pseudomonadota bacterium]
MDQYDVLVIGAGPAGYVAAIRAAQLGLSVACVERWIGKDGKPALGGTCLNVGCIPSKALLDSSEQYHRALHQFPAHGITVDGLSMDVPAMVSRKDAIVKQFTGGIAGLFRKHGVDWLQGSARLVDGGVIVRPGSGGEQQVQADHVIIATGSVPVTIPAAPVDGTQIVDSSGALDFTAVPERLGIIGAGVIGLELGSVWRRLGSEVVILEALPEFLATADREVARAAARAFQEQGLDIRLNARVTGTETDDSGVEVHYDDANGAQSLRVDKLIVAVGRRACTDGLDLDAAGIGTDEKGRIAVDARFRTGAAGVYAIGDVIAGPMLAHKASEDGVAVAELIAGRAGHVDYDLVPWVIYTWPEIAWVGATEQSLQAAGTDYRSGKFPYAANGRARAMEESAGFAKVLTDAATDRVLGVHLVGPYASEMIGEAVVAMAFHASAEDIARIVHAHPTLSEALHEAALATDGRALHV